MKKASKLLWVLLALSMVLVVGCDGDDNGGGSKEPADPAGWKTVWFQYDLLITDVNLHFGDQGGGKIQIQKIFLNDVASKIDASVIFDFTNTTVCNNDDFHWVPTILSHGQDVGTANGRFEFASASDYAHGGGFAHKKFNENGQIGFLIKTGAAEMAEMGDARFETKSGVITIFKDLVK